MSGDMAQNKATRTPAFIPGTVEEDNLVRKYARGTLAENGNVKMREEDLPVSKLEVDPNVQRAFLKQHKVQDIVSNFDPKALGRILVSERRDRSLRVLDGWHRVEAVRRLTDNEGFIPSEVYTGLELAQEAELFLLRNAGDRPTTIDRYRVAIIAGEPEAVAIDALLHSFGWKVALTTTQSESGLLSCVVALRNLYRRSVIAEQEPNLVHMALLIISRAWGNARYAGQGHIVTALGRLVEEYGDRLDIDALIDRLRNFKGGPLGLTTSARQFASLRKMALPMATADLIVEDYNKGRGSKTRLPAWSKRH